MTGRHWIKGLTVSLAVMLLGAGMVAGLFYQAAGVTMTVEPQGDTPHQGQSSVAFDVQVEIPEDEHVPIENVRAVVESAEDDDKQTATVVADESCPFPIQEPCPDNQGPQAIQNINFNTNLSEDQHGYSAINVDHTGYGYNAAYGYGYSLDGIDDGYGYDNGYGYGYGNGAGATLNFTVTLNPSQLDQGHHWLTFILDTGLELPFQELHAPAEHFEVNAAPSTPGGGSGGGGGASPGVGQQASFVPGQDVSFPSVQLPDGVSELSVRFSDTCEDCSVNVDSSPDAPPGAPSAPGVNQFGWFQLTVTQGDSDAPLEGVLDGGTLSFEVDQDALGDTDPDTVYLLRSTDDGWEPLATEHLGGNEFQAHLPGFSYFVAASDDVPPQVIDHTPADDATVGPRAPVIEVVVDDDSGLNLDDTRLLVDRSPVSFDASPTTTNGDHCMSGECTLTYDLANAYANSVPEGTYNVLVEAVDPSGNAIDREFEFHYQTACDTPPALSEATPRQGAIFSDQHVDVTLELVGSTGACSLDEDSITLSLDFEPLSDVQIDETRDEDGALEAATLSTSATLEDGEHTLQIEATNEVGQRIAQAWTFIVDTTPPLVSSIQEPVNGLVVPEDADGDAPIPETIVVTTGTPELVIGYEEPASEIDEDATELTLDGEPLSADVQPDELRYAFSDELDDGAYEMQLTLTDEAGNTETHSWTMEVDTGTPAFLLVLIILGALVLLGAAGYALYQRRPPSF